MGVDEGSVLFEVEVESSEAGELSVDESVGGLGLVVDWDGREVKSVDGELVFSVDEEEVGEEERSVGELEVEVGLDGSGEK